MATEQNIDSHLFTIRVWLEDETDGQTQCRGKLCHVPSGEIRHFRGWDSLLPLMLDILRRYPNPQPDEENQDQKTAPAKKRNDDNEK